MSLALGSLTLPCWRMFTVSEAEASAIRAAFDQGGEFAAAIELRRLFPGIRDNDEARACARTIASWKLVPEIDRPALSGKRRSTP